MPACGCQGLAKAIFKKTLNLNFDIYVFMSRRNSEKRSFVGCEIDRGLWKLTLANAAVTDRKNWVYIRVKNIFTKRDRLARMGPVLGTLTAPSLDRDNI